MMKGMRIKGVEVSYEAACHLLTTAVDAGHTHGFGYWAELVECKASQEGLVYAIKLRDHERTEMSGWVERDAQDASVGWVRQMAIKRAVEAMIADPLGTCSMGWTAQLLSEEIPDGPLAEAIVQVACFGKVIYR